jgi:hypothetical protein
MQFKKLVILIFILLLLVALYIFTTTNNNNNITPISPINSIIPINSINSINVKREDTFKSNMQNDDSSNVNNKIKITNRDNSLLQQFIKNDNVNNLQTSKNMNMDSPDKQKEKEFQKGIREDIEEDVNMTLIKLKDISADASIGIKTSVPLADTLINNDKYKGYNNYESLRKDSYAPVTSIGKKLITPFASYPIAS